MIIFDHGDNIVHMGKTIAQKGAHVVKDGIRRKTAVGETTKAYFNIHKYRKLGTNTFQVCTFDARNG